MGRGDMMGVVTTLRDGFQNLVANLGTSRDKAAFSGYVAPTLDLATIINAYRGAWLPRKIVDIPALDSCRAWRAWQAEADTITAIEAEEHRLDVQGKTLKARIAARLYGGAALLIGTGDADPSKPLDPATVKQGGIKYLTLVHKRQLTSAGIETDPASPYFDKPSMWQLNANGGQMANVHPSRLVMFTGAEMPDPTMAAVEAGWGDSVLMPILEAITHADSTTANIASLVFEAKVDVIKIKDFTQDLRMGGTDYEQLMIKRFRLAATAKGINGALLLDAEEDYQQKAASFAGLPDVLDRFLQLCAGAADIPLTRLLGQSPAGMNATGQSDLTNYYDRISASQELDMAPAMRILDECLIRSALGDRPPEVHYVWRPLWQNTAKEKAEIGKMNAETMQIARDMGLPEEVAGEALVNILTEGGAFPGLEGYANAYFGPGGYQADDPADTESGVTPPDAGGGTEGERDNADD